MQEIPFPPITDAVRSAFNAGLPVATNLNPVGVFFTNLQPGDVLFVDPDIPASLGHVTRQGGDPVVLRSVRIDRHHRTTPTAEREMVVYAEGMDRIATGTATFGPLSAGLDHDRLMVYRPFVVEG